MAKGPRVHPDIDKYIAYVVSRNPLLQAGEIEVKLTEKFVGTDIPIPSIRTIQDRAKRIRDRLTIQDKPWSLAAITGENPLIPLEAAGFIMESIIDLESRIRSGKEKLEELWPYTFGTLTSIRDEVIQPEEEISQRELLTNRQAKWLWRLHLIFPRLKAVDLVTYVDAYVQRELERDYLGWKFDTYDLDNALLIKLRHIVTHGYYEDPSQSNGISQIKPEEEE
ncbi:hypothetical protein ES703_15786 [subsurface metagenome]|jgi:hypothetical protein